MESRYVEGRVMILVFFILLCSNVLLKKGKSNDSKKFGGCFWTRTHSPARRL